MLDMTLPTYPDGNPIGIPFCGAPVVGPPYRWSPEDARAALSAAFDEPAVLEPGAWKLPAGAFGESCGPT